MPEKYSAYLPRQIYFIPLNQISEVSSVSTPVSVHKETKSSESGKKAKSGTGSSHPSTGNLVSLGTSSATSTAQSSTSQYPGKGNTSYTHSSRFPENNNNSCSSNNNNNLVLDLISIRPSGQQQQQQQQSLNNNLCNYSLAIQSDGGADNESGDIDPTAIEESILETFQRIDAQNVSNSYEAEEDTEQKMSIIENPLSESVMQASKPDAKTIPYHKVGDASSRGDASLYATPSGAPPPSSALLTPLIPSTQAGDFSVLNNRVDELTRQLQSLQQSVASDIRLILTLLQQQQQQRPQTTAAEPEEERSGPPVAPQRSLSIPNGSLIAHRKSPSSDLSQSWTTDQHPRSSSESHRLHSASGEDGARPCRDDSGSDAQKRHSSKETIVSDDYLNLRKTSDTSKSLSDGNVTRLADMAPTRSISQPIGMSQERRVQPRRDEEDVDEDAERAEEDAGDSSEDRKERESNIS
ncbi:UNVERIFIED_CONTAM: hypothetical protein PYX00_004298 [Menopon gallinae]|uniref:Uncharacterized protein n=1 Tax=Menopon gallinae TaxID=328185 RepID=A0AAW2I4P1_9NEOP